MEDFFKKGELFRYKKNDLIIDTGKSLGNVYLIKGGYVKVSHFGPNGEKIFAIYKAGEIFPLISAIKNKKISLNFILSLFVPVEKFSLF